MAGGVLGEINGNVLIQGTAPTLTDAVEGNSDNIATLATFVDTGGADPVANYTATINWGDGTSPTLGTITGSSGVFTVSAAHTWATPGTYTITITLSDTDGAIGEIVNTITVDDALITPSAPVPSPTVTAGSLFTGAVATFTYGDPGDQTADFDSGTSSITINWGDGNTSPGTVTYDPATGQYTVTGSNTYEHAGVYTLSVTITDQFGQTVFETYGLNVGFAALNGIPVSDHAVEGQAFTNQVVAKFTDANPFDTSTDYVATINWGDGSLPTSRDHRHGRGWDLYRAGVAHVHEVRHLHDDDHGPQRRQQQLGHDRQHRGRERCRDHRDGRQRLRAGGAAHPGGHRHRHLHRRLRERPDQRPFGHDQLGRRHHHEQPGTIVSKGGGKFAVEAGYTYANVGNYAVTVTINDVGGSTATANSFATISDAPINATPVNFTTVEGQTLTTQVAATFIDGDQFAPASNFTATIDWGDGNGPQPAQVTALGGGNFEVSGSIVYQEAQPSYPVTVSIVSAGGSTAQAVGSAVVTDAPLIAGAPFTAQATEGIPFSGATATFEDGNPFGSADDFLASISWGDGTSSNAIVTETGIDPITGDPIFGVSSSGTGHTYANVTLPGQSDPIAVTVIDLGGSRVTLNGKAIVADAPLTVNPVASVLATAGTAFTGVVATFSSADPTAPESDFSATISWGDGHVSTGTIALETGAAAGSTTPVYTVTGTNTYAIPGTDSINVTVNDVGAPRRPRPARPPSSSPTRRSSPGQAASPRPPASPTRAASRASPMPTPISPSATSLRRSTGETATPRKAR